MSAGRSLTLTRVLHPCVLLEGGGARALIDPCFGFFALRRLTAGMMGIGMPAPGLQPESLQNLDLIAMTHAHEDHFDEKGLERIPTKRIPVVVATSSHARRVRRLGFGDVSILPAWESAAGGAWRITAVPARAPNARREISFVLSLGGISILHAGDTAVHPWFEEIRDRCAPEAGCLPVNGVSLLGLRLTMTAEQAARAAALLGLRLAIPIHAEMRFDRLSALLYRARGTEAAFAGAARRLAPATRVLLAPRGDAVELAPLLDAPAGLRYPDPQ